MFDYIKGKILEQEEFSNTSNNDDAAIIVEYAHLFQELDELSVDGTDADKTRHVAIDIPIEDDIELDSIELNLSDGRITDIPMDATVQESDYTAMKTFDEFYQEAVISVRQFPRESSESVNERRMNHAKREYDKYKNHVIQEGLFGFDKISISDPRVLSSITADFGPISPDKPDKSYYVKLPIMYQVDKKQRILKKQMESVNHAVSVDAFAVLAKHLLSMVKEDYPKQVEGVENIWDVLTPKSLIVPVDPIDSYKVIVEFECDFTDKPLYYSYTRKIKEVNKQTKGIMDKVEASKINEISVKSKKEYIKESYEMRRPTRFGNVFQEAIDFGDGDVDDGDNASSVENEPPMNVDSSDEPTVSTDDTSTPSTDDTNDTNASDTGINIDVNDVSDQIAQKVSEETSKDDNSVPDIPNDDTSLDSTDIDDSNGDSSDVDKQLDDLDDMGNSDMDLDSEAGDIDVNNMTIEELLEQGSEKLKGMTIQQLKDFLASADNTTLQEAFVMGNENVIQEAVILTKKNINKEIDVQLRTALGILNDNEMQLDELLSSFKKEGKKLNKILSKASKMKKVYTDDECENIIKLNKCLTDLIVTLRSSQDSSYVATVKRLIQAFISQSAVVAKIVEDKKNDK
jgi:hypothetical protein